MPRSRAPSAQDAASTMRLALRLRPVSEPLPHPYRIASALAALGVDPAESIPLARSILAEVAS